MVYDVLVIGAGPAGSAAATLLGRRGARVGLVDRARFPRRKPCAEYVSPGAVRVLHRLLAVEALEAARPVTLHGMRITGPGGTTCLGRFGRGEHGLTVRREMLDQLLVETAVACGVDVFDGVACEGLSTDQRAQTVRIRTARGVSTVAGRLVVGADGLNSRVARSLGAARRGRPERVAVVGHAHGVTGMAACGELHVDGHGYVGLAPMGAGVTNVSVVVDLRRSRPSRPLDAWLLQHVRSTPTLSRRFAGAALVTNPVAVGPFARRTVRAAADRAMLVGDAADFHDPFTGEGILAALRGAEMVAAAALPALEEDTLSAGALRRYDRARRRAFAGKWVLERLLSAAVARPMLLEHALRRLATEPNLADLLVRATGGTVSPGRALRPGFLWRLLH